MNTPALKILTKPTSEWCAIAEKLPPHELDSLRSEAEGLAQRAALLAGYLSGRQSLSRHADGADRANGQLVRVRKAMGFSYPKNVSMRIA